MRAGLALMVFVVCASPAQACHRFSVWKYPYAQRCEVTDRTWYVQFVLPDAGKGPEANPTRELPPFTVSKYDTIVLAPEPGRTDEGGRAQAIEILKEVMGK